MDFFGRLVVAKQVCLFILLEKVRKLFKWAAVEWEMADGHTVSMCPSNSMYAKMTALVKLDPSCKLICRQVEKRSAS